jgi:hypothetical protein
MNDLPGPEEIDLAIIWGQYADHFASTPVHKPLFALADDVVGFSRAPKEQIAIA